MIRQILKGGRTAAGPLVADGAKPERPAPWLDPPPGEWTLERSYAYCEEIARARSAGFPVASRLVPAPLRPHLIALYAFARTADDFADEPQFEGKRVEALDRWEEDLFRCFHGEATHPVFIALRDTVEKKELSLPPFEDLLTAYRMDLDTRRYATFLALRGYTARSADPVGRLILALFGYRDAQLVRFADEISTALQLTNFWQDVAADAARGHIYLPAEDLHFFGVTEAELKALRPTPAIRDLLRFEVARTRAIFDKGRPLLARLGHDLKAELALIWLIGTALLDKIEDADFDVFSKRPALGKRDKAKIVARAAKHLATHLEDLATLKRLWP